MGIPNCFSIVVCIFLLTAGRCKAIAPPIINVAPLFETSLDSLACAREIDSALIEYGVFVAINHPISHDKTSSALHAGNTLFSLDNDVKLAVSVDKQGGIGRGYLPFGRETGLASYFEPKEGYSYGNRRNSAASQRNDLEQPNIWPEGLSEGIISTFGEVFDAEINVAISIITALARINRELVDALHSTSKPIDYEGAAINGSDISIMRIFHYLPEGSTVVEGIQSDLPLIGSSPHTDWGFLTLILHDGVRGLQFFHDNQWNDVPDVPNGIVVNGGDYLHLLSAGRYRSPIHRVNCPLESAHRLSFVLFFYPGYNVSLAQEQDYLHDPSAAHLDVSISGEIDNKKSFEYNTLLVQAGGTVDKSRFGDYILQKWRGVLT